MRPEQGLGPGNAALAAPLAPLHFVSLRLPDDLARARPCVPQLESLLHTTLAEARCTEDGQAAVYVGTRQHGAELLAPWLAQTLRLPLRIGEKVVWSLSVPSIRLKPMAQLGVLVDTDALALLEWLRRSEPLRAIVLTDVATSQPLYAAALNARGLGYVLVKNEPDTHLFHRFGASYAGFFGALSSKYRNQLRKKEKVFVERMGTAFALREYRLPTEVQEFLNAASAINKKTYQYRMFGESVDNDAASLAAGERAALAGAFRSFILWHDEEPLCFVLGHQRADGTYEHRQTGYDPAWRDLAPGIVCNLLMFKRLYEVDRPRILDFGSGDSDYKRMFSNESCVTANPVLVPNQPRYMVPLWLFRTFADANAAAVRLLDRLRVKEWAKRRLRRAA